MNYLHNCISENVNKKGFTSFRRFYPQQLAAYQENAMLKAMAKSTAGMYLGFYTTGNKITFTCKTENRLKVILPILRQVKMKAVTKMIRKMRIRDFYPKKQKSMIDGIDLIVDDTLIKTVKAKKKIHFQIDNPKHEKHRVCIYFPAIESLSLKDLEIQGEVMELEPKETMLCLGDSITQGLIAGGPSLNYVALLADYLGMDALNQGVGGDTFEVESLNGLEQLPIPRMVTVAYGTNDWTNKESLVKIREDIHEYFKRLVELYHSIPIFVLTPIWRADQAQEVPSGVPFETMKDVITEEVSAYENITIIDGSTLVDPDTSLYADSFLHPNAVGFAQMAKRVAWAIKGVLEE